MQSRFLQNIAQNGTSLFLSAQLLLASGMLRSITSMPTILVDLGFVSAGSVVIIDSY